MPLTRSMATAKSQATEEKATVRNDRQPKKRVRTIGNVARPVKAGGKASLKRMMDMPLEVFNEIASYLAPPELLSLARSNKFFRHMFMSRSSVRLWKTAFSNMPEIPDCPKELCEPQYASLLFSKTCSNCGARVLRSMDPHLLVRLCNSCRDETLCEVPVIHKHYDVVHRSTLIKKHKPDFFWTLGSDLVLLARKREEFGKDEKGWVRWVDNRVDEMEKSQRFGDRLDRYLVDMEVKRETELEDLKAQRKAEAETRLLDNGWEKRDMMPAPSNVKSWNALMLQPQLITDRIWTNLYPKLVTILESNQIYHKQIDQEKRQRDRVQRLDQILTGIRATLPPLVRVVFKEGEPSSSTNFHKDDYPDVTVEMPFPTSAEALKWKMIKDMVEKDTSQDEMEENFKAVREEFDREVTRWRENIERDAFDIWKAGREEEFASPQGLSSGKAKTSKGKATGSGRISRRSKGRAANVGASTSRAISTHADVSLPQFTVIFTKPDNTTTTDIAKLPSTTQILLRADTMFRSPSLRTAYPGIVPVPSHFALVFGTSLAAWGMSGEEWQPSLVTRDEDKSAIATELLARLGKTGATSAEMTAIGPKWKCRRCNNGSEYSWEDLVSHYRAEQGKWKTAQAKLSERPDLLVTYNNTHDLGPSSNKLFVQLMTPSNKAQHIMAHALDDIHLYRSKCLLCERADLVTQYFHKSLEDSPILLHLQDVHDIHTPNPTIHYQQWDDSLPSYDPYESDSYDSDSDYGFGFYGLGYDDSDEEFESYDSDW